MEGDFRILEWLVRPHSNTLVGTEKTVRIEPKVMGVLLYLAGRAGEPLSKEEIIRAVWDEQFISDEVLTVSIHELRKALGDVAKSPRFIKTIPKKGYQLIAPVVPACEEVCVNETAAPRATSNRGWKAAAALCAPVLILLFAIGLIRWSDSRANNPVTSHIKSIAVLPLENLSSDPEQGFFADGMTDALITDLARLGAVRVISRTSVMEYKEVKKPLREIARELNVDAVVEGTVLRSGEKVRITVQLIDAATDEHIWAEKYERPLRDVISLQNEVVFDIARRVAGKLDGTAKSAQSSEQPFDPQAYESYLKGRYFWNQRTKEAAEKAVGYFEQAIAAAPDYAHAYAGLADCYTLGDGRLLGLSRQEAYSRATKAVLKALEIDERLAEAHVSLGAIKFHDWDWQGAEAEFRRAVELNPNSALAYQWYGELLSALARHDEAVWAMERARNLDPLELMVNGDLAWVYYMARRYDLALAQIQKTLELDPQMVWMHRLSGSVYRSLGREREAVESHKRAMVLSGADPQAVSHLTDMRGLYRWWLKQARKNKDDGFPMVTVYAALGQNDKAIGILEEAYRERHSLLWLKVAPGFDRLRTDSRFIALLRRLGLES